MDKHTDAFIERLVVNSEGKIDCKQFNTDGWGGCERVLPPEIEHYMAKIKRSVRLWRNEALWNGRMDE
ncbi:hypothetical protein IFO70_20060 [Phormidium tenue FACHB-886]|nr:hypothetical protein [Phormidium tenue FACHB-886]